MTEFDARYAAVVRTWPPTVHRRWVDGQMARTNVLVCGDETQPPLLCLSGGSDSGAAWYAQAASLHPRRRMIAPDVPGASGLSERRALRTRADLAPWIDETIDGVGATRVEILAHSYGALLAVDYALHRPDRVVGLTLLDPTSVFTRIRPITAIRALPLLAAPSARRARRFMNFETEGNWPPSPEFGELAASAADGPRPHFAIPTRPTRAQLEELRDLEGGVAVVVALRSKYHDGPALARLIAERYPFMTVDTLPVSHHQLPFAYSP